MAKILGHRIHPILIVFPLGLLATAVIFEIIYYATGTRSLTDVTYWMLISGVIGGHRRRGIWFDRLVRYSSRYAG